VAAFPLPIYIVADSVPKKIVNKINELKVLDI